MFYPVHKGMIFELFSEALWMLPSKTKMVEKWHQHGAQKGVFILGVAPLGAPLVPQSVFGHKKYTQSAPKMTPRVQKLPQNASKITPRSQNGLLQERQSGSSASKMSAARYQARRTARSAYNNNRRLHFSSCTTVCQVSYMYPKAWFSLKCLISQFDVCLNLLKNLEGELNFMFSFNFCIH